MLSAIVRAMPPRRPVATLALAALALSACAQPFDYDAASPESRQAWIDSAAEGMADGIERTLPRGTNGFYAEMGPTRTDAEARTIDVAVNITDGGDRISISSVERERMIGQLCGVYLGSDLERNRVTVSMRYMLPGGGSALSVTMSPDICDSYRT